ncbi:MAG: pitrilysin family protein [Bacilli bacterium]|nr:pitrilysin family protein [Bacilli bacterium]
MKYEYDNLNLHILKNKKFKKNIVSIEFKRKAKKEEMTLRNLLSIVLVRSCRKYPKERDLLIKSEELYDVAYNSRIRVLGWDSFLTLSLTFLSPKYTEKNMFFKSMSFLTELLLSPNVKNGAFDEEIVNQAKAELKEELLLANEQPYYLAMKGLLENIDSSAPFTYSDMGYIEDLDNITPTKLYDYYVSVLDSDSLDIFICGDVDVLSVKKVIKEKFSKLNKRKKYNENVYHINKKTIEDNYIVKEIDNNQSIMNIGFKALNLNDFELRYVWYVYNYILGGSANSKLFRDVREKESLCYDIHSSMENFFDLMIISTGINAINEKKAKELILKSMDEISKGHFLEKDIKDAINSYIYDIKANLGTPYGIVNLYRQKYYFNSDNYLLKIKNIKKVDKNMVIDLSKKFKLDTIYFLKGVNDD